MPTLQFVTVVSVLLAAALPALAQQGQVVVPVPVNPVPPAQPMRQAFQGSVPAGSATGEALPLSLDEALKRGLQYNLGGFLARQTSLEARGQTITARSVLLPNMNGSLREVVEQLDLAALGFNFNFPPNLGIAIPKIVGPFNYFDLRGFLTQKVADVQALRNYQSAREMQRASDFSIQDARDMVVYLVTAGYLQVIADAARVDSARAQVQAAQAVFQQASDRFTSGVIARIDMTRSNVELETQQQRLTGEQAQYAKEKIALARLIGLPSSQEITLTDQLPFAPLENLTLGEAIQMASENRSDLKAAEAQLHAAELSRKGATAEHYPTLDVAADYGDIGVNPSNSHGTFTVAGELRFPIWAGNRAQGDIDQAEAQLQARRAEYQNLREQVEADVRTAFLDLNAAAEQVRVAQSRRELARDTLQQSTDRFTSGVADTVEVVQAQEAVASAEEDYIASLNAHNLAKAAVARAAGAGEKITRTLLRTQ